MTVLRRGKALGQVGFLGRPMRKPSFAKVQAALVRSGCHRKNYARRAFDQRWRRSLRSHQARSSSRILPEQPSAAGAATLADHQLFAPSLKEPAHGYGYGYGGYGRYYGGYGRGYLRARLPSRVPAAAPLVPDEQPLRMAEQVP